MDVLLAWTGRSKKENEPFPEFLTALGLSQDGPLVRMIPLAEPLAFFRHGILWTPYALRSELRCPSAFSGMRNQAHVLYLGAQCRGDNDDDMELNLFVFF